MEWCINLIFNHILVDRCLINCMDKLSAIYITLHAGKMLGLSKLSFIYPWHNLECYMANMDVIPFLGWLYNGRRTSPLHLLMKWEGSQYLYGWCVNAEDESAPVFIHLPMAHHLDVICCCMVSMNIISCLIACEMVYQPHPHTPWWIAKGGNTYMDD